MKIEITIEGQEPMIHKLSKDKTLLGAGQDCDVVVEADGISRKHLLILVESDQYFVVDQGSTNGSFINEERLVPGQRTNFTSFFPLKLGFHVTLALLSDEDSSEKFDFAKGLSAPASEPAPKPKSAPSQASGQLVPRTPGRSATAPAMAKGTPAASKGPRPDKKKDESSMAVKVVAFIIAVGGSAAFFIFRGKEEVVMDVPVEVAAPVVVKKVSDYEFRPLMPEGLESAQAAITALKCGNEGEVKLCKALGLPLEGYLLSGVVFNVSSISLVLPALPTDEVMTVFGNRFRWNEETAKKTADYTDPRDTIGLFLGQTLPLDWSGLNTERRWLYVGFVDKAGQPQGEWWVADLLKLRELALRPDEFAVVLSEISSLGPEGAASFGGLFRRARSEEASN